jgi:threonine/homoserine/homoserine lactone efflux protein
MPIEWSDLLVFTAAALALNLTPGNDMMYVLGRGLSGGARAGIAGSLGVATGSLIHLALVALGVAVVLAEHPLVFDAMRWAGAAYLLWVAFRTLTTPISLRKAKVEGRGLFAAWRDGVIVNVFNPKTIVFMFAFLPPFVRPENGQPLLQLFILGMLFNAGGTTVNISVAFLAGGMGEKLATNARLARALSIASASVLAALAAKLAFERR